MVKLKDPSDPHPFLDHQIAERAEEAAVRVYAKGIVDRLSTLIVTHNQLKIIEADCQSSLVY